MFKTDLINIILARGGYFVTAHTNQGTYKYCAKDLDDAVKFVRDLEVELENNYKEATKPNKGE